MLNIADYPTTNNDTVSLLRRNKNVNAKLKVVQLTPDMAAKLLANNQDNRAVSKSTVERFARDIMAGRWVMNGEPIIVADTGELNDGQHRCHAVVLADKPITTALVSGVPRSARFTTDMGYARTTGHFLGMSGVADGNVVARIASLLLQIDKRGTVRRGTGHGFTKQEILDYAYSHMDEIQFGHSFATSGTVRRLGPPATIATAAVVLARHAPRGDVSAFVERLIDGTGLNKTSPVLAARERIISEQINKTLNPHKTIEIILRCWNALRKGKRIRLAVMGEWPEVEG